MFTVFPLFSSLYISICFMSLYKDCFPLWVSILLVSYQFIVLFATSTGLDIIDRQALWTQSGRTDLNETLVELLNLVYNNRIIELRHEKTGLLPILEQRRRSASQ